MNALSTPSKGRLKHQPPQKRNLFVRSTTTKQKRQKQTILYLLHQERIFECQNNREMINNTLTTNNQKRSAEKSKFKISAKQTFYERVVTLTPKFKKHNLSQSKLPPLHKKEKKEINQPMGTLTPWEQEGSNNLGRPLSSKFLPY